MVELVIEELGLYGALPGLRTRRSVPRLWSTAVSPSARDRYRWSETYHMGQSGLSDFDRSFGASKIGGEGQEDLNTLCPLGRCREHTSRSATRAGDRNGRRAVATVREANVRKTPGTSPWLWSHLRPVKVSRADQFDKPVAGDE
jgi:hypothetical protein